MPAKFCSVIQIPWRRRPLFLPERGKEIETDKRASGSEDGLRCLISKMFKVKAED